MISRQMSTYSQCVGVGVGGAALARVGNPALGCEWAQHKVDVLCTCALHPRNCRGAQ